MKKTHDWFRKPGSFDETLEKVGCLNRAGIKMCIRDREVCAVITAVFTCGLTVGAEIYEAGRLYNFDGLSAPVQNISFLQNVPFSINIGQFLCIWIFMRLLIYIMTVSYTHLMCRRYSGVS